MAVEAAAARGAKSITHQYVRLADAGPGVAASRSQLLAEGREDPQIEDVELSPPLPVAPATAMQCLAGHRGSGAPAAVHLLAVSAGRLEGAGGVVVRVYAVGAASATGGGGEPTGRQVLVFRFGGAAVATGIGGRGSAGAAAGGGSGTGPEEDDDAVVVHSAGVDESAGAAVPFQVRGAARVSWLSSQAAARGAPRAVLAVATAAGVLLVHVDATVSIGSAAGTGADDDLLHIPHPNKIDPAKGAAPRSGTLDPPSVGALGSPSVPWRFIPLPAARRAAEECEGLPFPVAMSLAASATAAGCSPTGSVLPLRSDLHLVAIARTVVLCFPSEQGQGTQDDTGGTEVAFMSETHMLTIGAAPMGVAPAPGSQQYPSVPGLDGLRVVVPREPLARWVMANGPPAAPASDLLAAIEGLRRGGAGGTAGAARSALRWRTTCGRGTLALH